VQNDSHLRSQFVLLLKYGLPKAILAGLHLLIVDSLFLLQHLLEYLIVQGCLWEVVSLDIFAYL